MVLSLGTKAKILPSANPDEVLVTFLYNYNGWAFWEEFCKMYQKFSITQTLRQWNWL